MEAYSRLSVQNITSYVQTLLHSNPEICDIDLKSRFVTDLDMYNLFDILSRKESVFRLDLSDNLLTDNGIRILVKLLDVNPHLRGLNIACNFFTSYGIYHLGRYLKTDDRLVYLDISGNSFSEEGYMCFFNHLFYNTGLKMVRINHGGMTMGAVRHLSKVVKVSPHFKPARLSLGGNGLSVEELKALLP